ncbi:Uncharacterized protein FWK35_00032074 [Aphis craccivora]|uniref:DUF4371 domain-containing protein n=1 Tax=Aphis craccivora TaxID=307492 RepID=A0A6G0WNH9_APHCR|nr:Uncharacterized protein FWK35_00032074 [Aphis craccivora]
MERTRNAWKYPLFGDSCDVEDNILLTYQDIMKFYEWTRHKIKYENETKKEPTYKEIETIVISRIKNISIPIVERKRIKAMLKTYHSKCKNLLKSHPKIPDKKLVEFRRSNKALFDIATCKCKDIKNCICPRIKKIPVWEQNFLIDQRTSRKMVIGSIDIDMTNQMRNTMKRKLVRQKLQCNSQTEIIEKLNISISSTSSEYDSEGDNKLQKKSQPPKTSFRAGAAIASAVLHNANCDSSEVIDKNKLRRKRKKQDNEPVLQILALYFDGRKDKTLCNIEKDRQKYRQIILEEHISLIKEPESTFLGYITLTSGTSKCIEQAITDHFLEKELLMECLLAVGCDGTNVNVGTNGGIIRLLEKRLNKPLQWIICLLHMNELLLRHLFVHIDGLTTGPQTFSGEIGEQLESCEKKSVVQFQPISTELPELLIENMSSDQKYLYRIVSAVITGIFPEDLKNKSPVKMSHARWLTRANRILRLYVSIEVPSENLTILATYVVKVYAPTWFSIKIHPTCKDGARHLWKLISASRYLSTELKAIIDPVIQRKWQQNITEPPILKTISDRNVQLFVKQKGEGDICLLRLPCHTQAVERAVKTVTEASSTLCNKSDKEGFIKAQIEARRVMPTFDILE